MIVSDEHRFTFMHIPKCAGTSVRKGLLPIDSNHGAFDRIIDHPELGPTHLAHLTLNELATCYPDQLEKIRDYSSLAILRDPLDRFKSAVHQRLREFKGLAQSDISARVFSDEVDTVIDYLSGRPGRISLEFVHFTPQTSYINLNGTRMIGHVHRLDGVGAVAKKIMELTGVRIDLGKKENVTTTFRFGRLRVARLAYRPYVKFIPKSRRDEIRAGLTRLGFYVAASKQASTELKPCQTDFINRFYAEDHQMYGSAAV